MGAPPGIAIAEQYSVGQCLSGLSWTLRNPAFPDASPELARL